jgi:hypothetical protein
MQAVPSTQYLVPSKCDKGDSRGEGCSAFPGYWVLDTEYWILNYED